MIDKPKKCCSFGEYKCCVPMPINGRLQGIDFCIADIVAALNAANITTIASCCGHNQIPPSICLEDGREIVIKECEHRINLKTRKATLGKHRQ